MNIEKDLNARSNSSCELCSATQGLTVYAVSPAAGDSADECVLICDTCRQQIDNADAVTIDHC